MFILIIIASYIPFLYSILSLSSHNIVSCTVFQYQLFLKDNIQFPGLD